jgi:acyl carrier protein
MIGGVDVKRLVFKAISEAKGTIQEKLDESQHLVKDVGMDSIDIVELSLELERTFDIGIPDADFEKWDTVGSVIQYIESKEAKQ